MRQTEAIAGAAAVDPGATGRLLESAKGKGLRELQDECRATRTNADPDPDATRARIHAKRSYRTWTDAEGTGHLHLTGPSGGDATPVPAGADAKILVRVDLEALLRGRAVDGETCEIAGLGPIAVSVVQEWMGNAFLATIVTKGSEITKVVHLGRRFTSEQRTALQWRDPICARKGCDNRLGLQYDHFEDWAHTHTTRVVEDPVECPRRQCFSLWRPRVSSGIAPGRVHCAVGRLAGPQSASPWAFARQYQQICASCPPTGEPASGASGQPSGSSCHASRRP